VLLSPPDEVEVLLEELSPPEDFDSPEDELSPPELELPAAPEPESVLLPPALGFL
jgi:hypothetical protein